MKNNDIMNDYYKKINDIMKFNFYKWHRFRSWVHENLREDIQISDVTLIKSLYGQLIQCQPHSDLPKTKRRYYYEIPANHSKDGQQKKYTFSYWLTIEF